MLESLAVVVVIFLDGLLHVIAVLEDDLVARVVLTSESEGHVVRVGLVQGSESIVPWHTPAQNHRLKGIDVVYFFISELFHDFFFFVVVLGASKLIVRKFQ